MTLAFDTFVGRRSWTFSEAIIFEMTWHVDVTYGDMDPWYMCHVSLKNGHVGIQKALNSCDICPHMEPLPRGIRHVINQTDDPHSSALDLCPQWMVISSLPHSSRRF
jgi:hypothetical protein